MLERNKRLTEEQEKLEKGRFRGQTIIHWIDGVARIIDFPKRPLRKELTDKKESK